MTTDPGSDWGNIDLQAALEASVADVRKRQGPLPPAGRPRVPSNNPTGDLSVGDLELTTARSLRWCRVCDQAIHMWQPMVSHWPDSPRTVISYDFHPTCLPEGTLP